MDVREQLLTAALKVYSTAGTRGATTRRIAREAGVNEVTLFRHFGSKDALLRDAIEVIYDRRVPTRLPDTPVDPEIELTTWCRAHHQFLVHIRSMLRTSMAEVAEHPEYGKHACRLPQRVADELHAYLLRLRASGRARGTWNARAATALLMGAVFADATQRDLMPERFPYSERDAVRHYVGLFLAAINLRRRRTALRRSAARRQQYAGHQRKHS
jgi:AcrR family transcriptional regulator